MGYNQPNTAPAIMQPTQEPPAYTKSGQQIHEPKPTLNTEELQVSCYKFNFNGFGQKRKFCLCKNIHQSHPS